MSGYDRVLAWLAEEVHVYVGLYELVYRVRRELRLRAARKVRQTVLALVRDLFQGHDVVAGRPGADWKSFVCWDLPVKCTLDRIDWEWSALGRDPQLGEIVYFVSPRYKELIRGTESGAPG